MGGAYCLCSKTETRGNLDDSRLAEGLRTGEQGAVRVLVERFHAPVYRFLHHLTRNREDAQDLAQQTLLKAVRNASRYDRRSPLRSWLFGIAVREYSRWRRRHIFKPFFQNQPDPADPMVQIVDAKLLLDALAKLEEGHRAVFLLHHVEGLSVEEVGEALSIPAGTVKSRLHNARQRLKTTLEREEFYVAEPCRS